MKMIQTVTGLIEPGQMGRTLPHEHFLVAHAGCEGDSLARFDPAEVVEKGVQMAESVQQYGIKTVVNATTNDYGRHPELLKEIAEKSGLNIICCSGYYNQAQGGTRYFNTLKNFADGPEMIYDLMKQEVTEGIGDTGIRAGILKVCTKEGEITEYEQMFFKAAARVSREEDLPIFTHTDHACLGPEQAEFLINEGADPKRIMIGHSCKSSDLAYLFNMLDKGVYIAYDQFGLEGVLGNPPDRIRITSLIGLLSQGHVDRIMLSHDWINYWHSRPIIDNILSTFLPKWGPTHLFKNVLPALKEAGVTDEQIEIMTVENPRRFFSGE